jgi:type IV pilus assembly protein PilY1
VELAGGNDNCSSTDPGIGRASDLVQRSIVSEGVFGDFDVRVTTDNVLDKPAYLSGKLGWYMDLLPPSQTAAGERVVSQALLRAGRIIFVTLIPDETKCSFGGTSWLMELDGVTGNRLDTTPFDISGDQHIDSGDMVTLTDTNNDNVIDENDDTTSASGKKSKVGIVKTPGVIGAGEVEYKYTSGSTGQLESTLESVEGGSGRQSWQQLR